LLSVISSFSKELREAKCQIQLKNTTKRFCPNCSIKVKLSQDKNFHLFVLVLFKIVSEFYILLTADQHRLLSQTNVSAFSSW